MMSYNLHSPTQQLSSNLLLVPGGLRQADFLLKQRAEMNLLSTPAYPDVFGDLPLLQNSQWASPLLMQQNTPSLAEQLFAQGTRLDFSPAAAALASRAVLDAQMRHHAVLESPGAAAVGGGRSIKVQGYPPNVDTNKVRVLLHQLFQQFGEVESVRIPHIDPSRGDSVSPHAFVNFVTAEAAEAAMVMNHKPFLDNRTLKLKLVPASKQRTQPWLDVTNSNPTSPNSMDMVGGMQHSPASLASVTSPTSTMSTASHVGEGLLVNLEGADVSPVTVDRSRGTVRVSGFPQVIDRELVQGWLLQCFMPFGSISSIRLCLDAVPPYALVDYQSPKSAEVAVQLLQNTPVKFIDGRDVGLAVTLESPRVPPVLLNHPGTPTTPGSSAYWNGPAGGECVTPTAMNSPLLGTPGSPGSPSSLMAPRPGVAVKVLGLPHGRPEQEVNGWVWDLFTNICGEVLSVRSFPRSENPYALVNLPSQAQAVLATNKLNNAPLIYGPLGIQLNLNVFLKKVQKMLF